MAIDKRLLEILRCPVSGQPLVERGDQLVTRDGSESYDVVDGIPCLLRPAEATHQGYNDLVAQNRRTRAADIDIPSFMDGMIVPTCGNLFEGVRLRDGYPIPEFPAALPAGRTLEVGCNWGRWSIAGAKAGHSMVGIDVHLESLMVARELARSLSPANPPLFVLADARYLPFAQDAFDGVFSYSVIQHFSRDNATKILSEVGRVLRPGGASMIQMPNRGGLKARLTMGRRRFAEGQEFDVRYYSIDELLRLFGGQVGTSEWSVDCFFGLNVHGWDRNLVPRSRRWIVDLAEAFYRVSQVAPPVARLSDSVYVRSVKA